MLQVRVFAQVDQKLSRKHVEALHLRIKEYRHELALCKKEAKRAARALRHAEVGLHARQLIMCPAGAAASTASGLPAACKTVSYSLALMGTDTFCRRQL